jgi:hypothetical protein
MATHASGDPRVGGRPIMRSIAGRTANGNRHVWQRFKHHRVAVDAGVNPSGCFRTLGENCRHRPTLPEFFCELYRN